LPQFADPLRGSLGVQLGLLGGVFIAATWCVFGSIALLAGALGQQLQRSVRWQRVINRGAAVVFLVLALKLLLEE
jgi:threonine/homoserine/homoserine lactone efflux protein